MTWLKRKKVHVVDRLGERQIQLAQMWKATRHIELGSTRDFGWTTWASIVMEGNKRVNWLGA